MREFRPAAPQPPDRHVRLRRDRRGVATVEFALLGSLFLFVSCAILEIGVELLTQMVLDQSVDIAARQVQIGNATTAATFAADLCAHVSTLLSSCTASVQTYATSGASFSALTPATVSGGTLLPSSFTPGTAGSDVLIQVAYTRPYLFSLVASITGSKSYTLLSTVAFQSEPY